MYARKEEITVSKMSKAKHLIREAIAVGRHPSVLPIVAMFWVMTRGMRKTTAKDREAAFALFAARMLGASEEKALKAVTKRREQSS